LKNATLTARATSSEVEGLLRATWSKPWPEVGFVGGAARRFNTSKFAGKLLRGEIGSNFI
jgi:hypothetical protein